MLLATDEILGFLDQSRISEKNIARLEQLAEIIDSEFQRLRLSILEIARLHPQKKRRWLNLPRIAPHLYEVLRANRFFDDWIDQGEGLSATDWTDWDDLDQDAMIQSDRIDSLNRYLQEVAEELAPEAVDSE